MSSPEEYKSEPTSQAMYQASRKRRKDKKRRQKTEGDITSLNITPMMDMMTILLVFLLKSLTASAEDVSIKNLVLPHSTTELKTEEALTLIITENEILVDRKKIMDLDEKNQVKPSDLPDGKEGYLIGPLYQALEERADYFKKIEQYGGAEFHGRIAIIADKGTNYKTLFKILYTAGRAEFGLFKLFVQKPKA